MNTKIWMVVSLSLMVAACGDVQSKNGSLQNDFLKEVPEGVLAIAASNQDLTAVKIDPVDGCYIYRYQGPVETTFLPLRAANGRPICSRPAEVPVTG